MAATCTVLSFASVIRAVRIVQPCGCDIGRSELPRDTIETELHVSGSRRGEYGLNYWSDNDMSSLVVDTEGQMARFVAKTQRVHTYVLCHQYQLKV